LSSSHLLEKLQKLYPKELPQCIPWYWSTISTNYYKPEPRRLFELGSDGPISTAFYKLYSLLDRSGYLDKNQDKGDTTDKIEAIHRSGIALMLHSEYQFGTEIPSHHFFDAVAASAVVIADRHPFIEKEFQDSVLYIDRERSGEELFQNIDELIEWVWDHQEEASLLAKKAHTIFQERFTIQKFLEDLEKKFETVIPDVSSNPLLS
jgi:predicted RNase H-like HicB family nuclease